MPVASREWAVSRRHLMAAAAVFGTGAGRAVAAAPKANVLRLAQSADVQPATILGNTLGNVSWRQQVFDTLTVLDAVTAKPRKVLATDWTVSADGRTVTVRIREGVTFHSGRPLTAADVVFTLQQMTVPANGSQLGPFVKSFTSIEASGSHEVTIRADMPIARRIFDVFQMAAIVDRESFGGLADGSRVIGTGPFTWDSWSPGSGLTLRRNAAYWMPERPRLDAIDIKVITDPTALANATRGGVHLVYGVPPRDTRALARDPRLKVVATAAGAILPLGMDTTRAPFDNKLLRQAVGYAVDRQRIVDQVFGGSGSTSNLFWPANEAAVDDAVMHHYTYDPDRAKAMVAQAGAVGTEVKVTVIGVPVTRAVYEVVQFNLTAIGLKPVANVLRPADFDERQASGALGPMFLQLHGLQGFSAATLIDGLPALRAGNPSHFNTDQYVALKRRVQDADAAAYGERLADLMRCIEDEAFNHNLAHGASVYVVDKDVADFRLTNVNYFELVDTWLAS